jgi:hypothetical protein
MALKINKDARLSVFEYGAESKVGIWSVKG